MWSQCRLLQERSLLFQDSRLQFQDQHMRHSAWMIHLHWTLEAVTIVVELKFRISCRRRVQRDNEIEIILKNQIVYAIWFFFCFFIDLYHSIADCVGICNYLLHHVENWRKLLTKYDHNVTNFLKHPFYNNTITRCKWELNTQKVTVKRERNVTPVNCNKETKESNLEK